MEIVLPPELAALVQHQIASGNYQSPLEVIAAGVQLLAEQPDRESARWQALREAVQIGWEAAQRGEAIERAAGMAQIRADLRSRQQFSV